MIYKKVVTAYKISRPRSRGDHFDILYNRTGVSQFNIHVNGYKYRLVLTSGGVISETPEDPR